MPGDIAGLFLFDALHGWGPGEVAKFLTARLDSELAHLHGIWTAKNGSAAADAISDEQVAWLRQSGFRFRGFASAKYAQIYKELKPLLAAWFDGHAAQLGGAGSCVLRMLSANYLEQAAVPAGPKHEPVVGGPSTCSSRSASCAAARRPTCRAARTVPRCAGRRRRRRPRSTARSAGAARTRARRISSRARPRARASAACPFAASPPASGTATPWC